jgi:DNA polymerase elongation subunit (family B)
LVDQLDQYHYPPVQEEEEGLTDLDSIFVYAIRSPHTKEYFDIRVAELVAAYGRYTLNFMQELGKSYGFNVVGGDTDSPFLQPHHSSNIEVHFECKEKLKVEVEQEKTLLYIPTSMTSVSM